MTPPSPKNATVECEAKFGDAERQASSLFVKPRKGSYSKKNESAHTVWNDRSAPEGMFPTVAVRDAVLGMVGKSIEGRRGLDVFSYHAGGEEVSSVNLAIGLDSSKHGDIKKLMLAAWEKIKQMHDPIHKSMWYQNVFKELDDGTKVFTATQAMQGDGTDFLSVSFEDDSARWESPSTTWAPFLFGESGESVFYTRCKIDPEARVFLFNQKKGGSEFNKTIESEQVVYPRGGICVRNINQVRTLLSSAVFKNNIWRLNGVIELTGVTLKCAVSGTTQAGNSSYTVYPVFTFKAAGSVVFIQHDASAEGSSGLTDKQREAAIRALVFEGMQQPRQGRRPRDANAPIFNQPNKKKKKLDSQEVEDDSDTEELDSDGETQMA